MIACPRSPTSGVSSSKPISVSRIVYHAVIPPSGASENLGNCGSGICSDIQRLGNDGSSVSARARPTTSTAPLSIASSACIRVLKPPVSIKGLVVIFRARLANSMKYGPRPAPSDADFAPGKYVPPLMSIKSTDDVSNAATTFNASSSSNPPSS